MRISFKFSKFLCLILFCVLLQVGWITAEECQGQGCYSNISRVRFYYDKYNGRNLNLIFERYYAWLSLKDKDKDNNYRNCRNCRNCQDRGRDRDGCGRRGGLGTSRNCRNFRLAIAIAIAIVRVVMIGSKLVVVNLVKLVVKNLVKLFVVKLLKLVVIVVVLVIVVIFVNIFANVLEKLLKLVVIVVIVVSILANVLVKLVVKVVKCQSRLLLQGSLELATPVNAANSQNKLKDNVS